MEEDQNEIINSLRSMISMNLTLIYLPMRKTMEKDGPCVPTKGERKEEDRAFPRV